MDHTAMTEGMDMGGGRCRMDMHFTWSWDDLCIVFEWAHVYGVGSLIFSLFIVGLIAFGYEASRAGTRRYESWIKSKQEDLPKNPERNQLIDVEAESTPLVGHNTERITFLGIGLERESFKRWAHLSKAILYALQTFYAYMLMLVFMTYNGWVMLAVTIGFFGGYLYFGKDIPATRDSACHD